MIKVVASDGQTWEIVQRQPVTRWIPEPTQNTGGGLLGLTVGGVIGGLGGYALGKKHGSNDGYNLAKAEDDQLIAQYEAQLQNMRREIAYLHGENNRLSQENGSLHTENNVLKGLIRTQSSNPSVEAILKTLGRVEFRLTQFLPPLFDNGEDHETNVN